MSFMEWDSSLDVGVADMNGEHKTWIGYINSLHNLIEDNGNISSVTAAFDKMHAYTKEHFAHEEQFLQKINYPLFDDHKVAHEEFLAEMQTSKSRLTATGALDEEFFSKLRGWLVRHIRIVDTQYGEFSKRMKKAM